MEAFVDTPESEKCKPLNTVVIPRCVSFLLSLVSFLVLIPLTHGVVPWAISSLTPRYGWTDGYPGLWNLLGIAPVVSGSAILIWVLVVAVSETPKRVELGLEVNHSIPIATPSFLMMRGPYVFTRNPMYVAELGLWLGWTILFGSLGVLFGFVVGFALLNFVVLAREESGLEERFGALYRQYKRRVPRWLGARSRCLSGPEMPA
jgi:protein-S-isoprenylcysteine O-methyltransferase Ste14